MSSSAIAHEFHIKEPTIYVNKVSLNTKNKVMNLSVDENVVTRGSTEPNHVFPLGAMVPVH